MSASAEAARPAGAARPGGWTGPLALAALCVLYAALAALPAGPGSDLVLATDGGSPDWLLGPLRFAGLDGADGALAGPLFYAGLWAALALYSVVLLRAREIPRPWAVGVVAGLTALFALAPPLLSQDVFSYIAYARLGIEDGLNPYTHAPVDSPLDDVFPFAGSKGATSVYGPFFTLLSYPLAPLGVAAAFWVLKIGMALAVLGIFAIVWRTAERLGRDPVLPALAVGINPLVLAHVVSAAHNEALVVLITMGGVLAWVAGREATGAALATGAAGVKASAGLVVPFLIAGSAARGAGDAARSLGGSLKARLRRIRGPVLAAAGAALAILVAALVGFGADALDALGLLSSNQERTSRWSIPYKTAELLGAVLPGERLDYRSAVRVVFGLAFAAVAAWQLLRAWRGADPLAAAGWTTLAVLIASAWLVPWYALWLLPLAALASDRRLLPAAIALCAWMLVIAVPL